MGEPAGVHRWCVQWRTPSMSGLAFWYFRTKREADSTAANMSTGTERTVRPVTRCYCTDCKALRAARKRG